ncbi:MAG: tRNA lysidine(34) synthetase TilS [Elusimicrobia bacterium]|nr:tRNA lysidine(34) synthetase TilS [Elusimicrobiota bacterium]
MKLIYEKFLAHVRENQLIKPTDKILAAVSCGPDSVCMLNLLLTLRKKLGFNLGIAYINHNLRPNEVKNEVKFILKTGVNLKLPVYIESVRIKKSKSGVESEARKVRYGALAEIANHNGYNVIATGHTLDDLAETVLLNLVRSRCEEGITAIPVKRQLTGKDILIIRPLLSLKKQEILAYLKDRHIKYCFDSSNKDVNFSRNLIRHEILPKLLKINRQVFEHFANLSKYSDLKETYFDKIAETAQKAAVRLNYNYVTLDLKTFFKYNPYLRWKLLKSILSKLNIQDYSKSIQEIFQFLASAKGGKNKIILKNISIERKGDDLVFKKTQK